MRNIPHRELPSLIANGDKLLLLFYATWCPFCRKFLKLIEENSSELKNEIVGVDISDEDSPLWEEYNVEIVPTLVAFSKGRQVARRDGVANVGLGLDDLMQIDRAL